MKPTEGIVNKDALVDKFIAILKLALDDFSQRKGLNKPELSVGVDFDLETEDEYPSDMIKRLRI